MTAPDLKSRLARQLDRLYYQPLSLGIVALFASGALSWAATATAPAIAAAEARDLANSLAEVLPAGFADNDLARDTLQLTRDGQPLTVHLARSGGKIKGAVFLVGERGYAGEIRVLLGIAADGRILGARVVKHSETPGLGDKIEAGRGPWIQSFAGKSLADPAPAQWAVKKDGGVFDQFAGATITPRAVVKAVRGGLEYFAAHRDDILQEKQP